MGKRVHIFAVTLLGTASWVGFAEFNDHSTIGLGVSSFHHPVISQVIKDEDAFQAAVVEGFKKFEKCSDATIGDAIQAAITYENKDKVTKEEIETFRKSQNIDTNICIDLMRAIRLAYPNVSANDLKKKTGVILPPLMSEAADVKNFLATGDAFEVLGTLAEIKEKTLAIAPETINALELYCDRLMRTNPRFKGIIASPKDPAAAIAAASPTATPTTPAVARTADAAAPFSNPPTAPEDHFPGGSITPPPPIPISQQVQPPLPDLNGRRKEDDDEIASTNPSINDSQTSPVVPQQQPFPPPGGGGAAPGGGGGGGGPTPLPPNAIAQSSVPQLSGATDVVQVAQTPLKGLQSGVVTGLVDSLVAGFSPLTKKWIEAIAAKRDTAILGLRKAAQPAAPSLIQIVRTTPNTVMDPNRYATTSQVSGPRSVAPNSQTEGTASTTGTSSNISTNEENSGIRTTLDGYPYSPGNPADQSGNLGNTSGGTLSGSGQAGRLLAPSTSKTKLLQPKYVNQGSL